MRFRFSKLPVVAEALEAAVALVCALLVSVFFFVIVPLPEVVLA